MKKKYTYCCPYCSEDVSFDDFSEFEKVDEICVKTLCCNEEIAIDYIVEYVEGAFEQKHHELYYI